MKEKFPAVRRSDVSREEQQQELSRLLAVVENLPKYADTGEPIVPGMIVHFWATRRVSDNWVVFYVFNDSMEIKKGKTMRYLHESDAYSTNEAAEASKKKPDSENKT